MATLTRSQQRNANLRAAVAAAFPGVSFTVRNGVKGRAHVGWTDGPTKDAVRDVLTAVPSDQPPTPWSKILARKVTPLLVAVSYVRADDNGQTYYTSRRTSDQSIVPRGEIVEFPDALDSWTVMHDSIDAATITTSERVRAELALTLIPVLPNDRDVLRHALAEIVYHRRDVLHAVFAPARTD